MRSGFSIELIICHSTPFLVCAAVALSGFVWDNTENLKVSLVVLAAMLMTALVTVHLAERVRVLTHEALKNAGAIHGDDDVSRHAASKIEQS